MKVICGLLQMTMVMGTFGHMVLVIKQLTLQKQFIGSTLYLIMNDKIGLGEFDVS